MPDGDVVKADGALQGIPSVCLELSMAGSFGRLEIEVVRIAATGSTATTKSMTTTMNAAGAAAGAAAVTGTVAAAGCVINYRLPTRLLLPRSEAFKTTDQTRFAASAATTETLTS